jgi:zinc D-Ala-D-Ala carboxypeptidase
MKPVHWTKIDRNDWPSIYFSPQEVACRRTGLVLLTPESREALKKLDDLRRAMGHPLFLNSAYRSPEHNRAVGGARRSYHMRGVAFDVNMTNVDPHRFEAEAARLGFSGIGIYVKSNFIHIDTRVDLGAARWRAVQQGAEFPRRAASRFAPETRPAPVAASLRDVAPVIGVGGALEAAVAQAEPVLREIAPALPGNLQGYAIAGAGLLALAVVAFRVVRAIRASRAEGAGA